MSRLNFEVGTLEMNEQCFPRIYFMKSRIRRIIPRMKRILDFVFNQPSEGIKRLRSDTEECDEIEKSVNDQTVIINIMFPDKYLASQLSQEKLAIEKKYITEMRKSKSVRPETHREDVLVVLIESSRLQCLNEIIKHTHHLSHAIIAVFGNDESLCSMYDWTREREANHQFALVYSDISQTTPLHFASPETVPSTHDSNLGPTDLLDIRKRSSPRMHLETPSDRPSSLEQPKSPSRKLPSFGIARTSPMRLSHSLGIQYPSLPRQRRKSTSPEKQSPESLSPKSRPGSPEVMPNVKRSKRDSDKLTELSHLDNAQASTSPMEIDEESRIDTHSETATPVRELIGNSGFKKLQECIQFQLEVKAVKTIERILKLLTDVRNRREESARVSTVTILDKLIYEVEGLLSLSNTNHGKELRKKFNNQTIDSKLREELFSINGLHGCGNFYHRMCVHIEPGDENVKDTVKRNIKEIMSKYNFTERDYDTYVARSEPTMRGELVLCKA